MWLIDNFKRAFAGVLDATDSDNKLVRSLKYARRKNQQEDRLIGDSDHSLLRKKCSDMARNNPIVAGVVERFADNVVGSGIQPQAKTSDPKWNEASETWFYEWSKIADYRQRIDLWEMQRMTVKMRLLHGDCGFVMLDNGQMQPVEAERIMTPLKEQNKPNVVNGVVLTREGIPAKYFIGQRDKEGLVKPEGDFDVVDAKDFIFCSMPRFRFDQVRGLPDLTPVVTSLESMDRMTKLNLNKAELDAMHAWAIYSDKGTAAIQARTTQSTTGTQYEKFEGGMNYYLNPHEKIESLASNTPNSQYSSFVELNLRLIGAALGLPFEFLLLDFSKGSYSSSRAALLQTYRTFTNNQEWLTRRLLKRVWNWRIAKAIKRGELAPAPVVNGVSEWYKVEWNFPEFGWVDPQNEVQAKISELTAGATTLSAWVRQKGRDAIDVMNEKGTDIANAHIVAQRIKKESGVEISWRDIMDFGVPGQARREDAKEPKKETAEPKDEADDEIA